MIEVLGSIAGRLEQVQMALEELRSTATVLGRTPLALTVFTTPLLLLSVISVRAPTLSRVVTFGRTVLIGRRVLTNLGSVVLR